MEDPLFYDYLASKKLNYNIYYSVFTASLSYFTQSNKFDVEYWPVSSHKFIYVHFFV